MAGPKQLQNLDVSNRRLNSTNVPLEVVILDGSGAQVTAFGSGGTQYTDGDQDATITGTALLLEKPSSNELVPAQGSTTTPASSAFGLIVRPLGSGVPLRSVLLTDASSGVSAAVDVSEYTRLAFLITHSNVSTGGSLVLEESDSSNSTLTWSAIATIDASTIGSSALKVYHVGGSFAFGHVRARIGSSISTGLISVALRAI